MTTVTCDICGAEIRREPIKVTFNNGEHPHNGSTMHKTADACDNCVRLIPNLESQTELDDMINKKAKTTNKKAER